MVCEKVFRQSGHLKRHKLTHTKKHSIVRYVKGHLVYPPCYKHINEYILERNHSNVCSLKRHSQSSYLKTHKQIHTGDKPFKCIFCENAFNLSCLLWTHNRSHFAEKPFKSMICEKSFSRSSDLKKHIWSHTGERPYKCINFEEAFSTLTWNHLNVWFVRRHLLYHPI